MSIEPAVESQIERQINEEYKNWKKNAPFLYDMVGVKSESWLNLI